MIKRLLKGSFKKYKTNLSDYLLLSVLFSFCVILTGGLFLCFYYSNQLNISSYLFLILSIISLLLLLYPILNLSFLFCHKLFFKRSNTSLGLKFFYKNYTKALKRPNFSSLRISWNLIKTIFIFSILGSLFIYIINYIQINLFQEFNDYLNAYYYAVITRDFTNMFFYYDLIKPYLLIEELFLSFFIIAYFVHNVFSNYSFYCFKMHVKSMSIIPNRIIYKYIYKNMKKLLKGNYFKFYFLTNLPIILAFYLPLIACFVIFSLFSYNFVFILIISICISTFIASFFLPMFFNNIIQINTMLFIPTNAQLKAFSNFKN